MKKGVHWEWLHAKIWSLPPIFHISLLYWMQFKIGTWMQLHFWPVQKKMSCPLSGTQFFTIQCSHTISLANKYFLVGVSPGQRLNTYTRVGKNFWCCNKSVCLIPISHGSDYCVHICELNPTLPRVNNPSLTLVGSIGSKMCSQVIAMQNLYLRMCVVCMVQLHLLFIVYCIFVPV